jgi:hypothetical protein
MVQKGSAYKVLVGKPEGRRRLGIPKRRWNDDIKLDRKDIGCEVVDWIHLAHDKDQWLAAVNTVVNLIVS